MRIKLIFCLIIPIFSFSQVIVRENIGSAGGTKKIDNIHFRHSIGQSSAAVGIVSNNGIVLRQGFQQPIIQIKKQDLLVGAELDVLVFPNPFTDRINIQFPKLLTERVYVSIYDNRGKIVKQLDYFSLQNINIPLDILVRGSYLLNIKCSNKNYNATLIKQ